MKAEEQAHERSSAQDSGFKTNYWAMKSHGGFWAETEHDHHSFPEILICSGVQDGLQGRPPESEQIGYWTHHTVLGRGSPAAYSKSPLCDSRHSSVFHVPLPCFLNHRISVTDSSRPECSSQYWTSGKWHHSFFFFFFVCHIYCNKNRELMILLGIVLDERNPEDMF